MVIQDVIIVGAGPAGLSAAVVLGRSRRTVLLFDTGTHRNRHSHGMHNYLTRDGILPNDFLKACYPEIKKYGVKHLRKKIVHAQKNKDDIFQVKDEDNQLYYAKKLLVATGVQDILPEIKGFKEMYGISIFHCPYCDGWEVKNKRLGVYARNKEGAELALSLKGWSAQVVLYTDGKNKVKPLQQQQLQANGIAIVKDEFEQVIGVKGQLKKIIFKNGNVAACDAIFFVNGYQQQCNIATGFDCNISENGVVITNQKQQTKTKGLFVAGDADQDVQFVVVAAAEGARAGVAINKELQKEITAAHAQLAKKKKKVST